jgi:hypothetical protein
MFEGAIGKSADKVRVSISLSDYSNGFLSATGLRFEFAILSAYNYGDWNVGLQISPFGKFANAHILRVFSH